MKNYKQTAADVLRLIGGEKNVSHLEHCSTRLRFTVADPAKVDAAALKKTPGVMNRPILCGQYKKEACKG